MKPDESLLRAILENPDDDAPRLVYADWLEERGDPRGEFIRVQVALSRLPEDAPEREPLREREQALLDAHRDAWLGPILELSGESTFGRGFVERVKTGVRQFLTSAPKLFALTPLREVKLLRLSQTKNGAEELAACPYLERLRGLDLSGSAAGDERLVTLLHSPYLRPHRPSLSGLTSLNLAGSHPGALTLARLGDNGLPKLRSLDLSGNVLSGHLNLLINHDSGLQLEHLNLSDSGLQAAHAGALADWPPLSSLRSLELANNRIRVTGAQALAASPHLGRLTRLGLRNCAVGVSGSRALAASAALAGLRTLDLSGNEIGINGLRALLDSPHLGALTALHVGGNGLGDEGVQDLAAWGGLARLRALSLWNDRVGDVGVAALVRSRHAAGLRELLLTFNEVGDAGLRALAESPYLEQLRELHLSGNYRLTEDGLRTLVESPCLPRLRVVQIDTVPVSPSFRKEFEARFDRGRQRRWPVLHDDAPDAGADPS